MKVKNLIALTFIAIVCSPAFAQLDKAKTVMQEVADWLKGLGVVAITIALMFVGFRMAFQAAQWKDVAPVFWGGILIGSAAGIAGMFI